MLVYEYHKNLLNSIPIKSYLTYIEKNMNG